MIITRTPLRLGLAGGGTDLPSYYRNADYGAVVNVAIDKYVYVILKKRYDDDIWLSYMKKEIVKNVDDIEHGLVREAMKLTGVTKGIEIAMLSDVPAKGTGLGSSSSVTVGLLNALYTYAGHQVPSELLARDACKIEIETLGKTIGKQDQYAAAYGGLTYYIFNKNSIVDRHPIELSLHNYETLQNNMLLFYSGFDRKAEDVLVDQNSNAEKNKPALDDMREGAQNLYSALLQGNIEAVPTSINTNWLMKKTLSSKITNRDLDNLVNEAYKAGASGCKITGAGSGGAMLVYAEPENQGPVREALANLMEIPFRFAKVGSRVMLNSEDY